MSVAVELATHVSSAEFEPMLATSVSRPSRLTYPILASAKLDGVRCLIFSGQPLGQMMTPIINDHVRDALSGLPALDGEITIGDPTNGDVWGRTMAGLMRQDGEPDFTYWVFDTFADSLVNAPYEERLRVIEEQVSKLDLPYVKVVSHTPCHSFSQVMMLERHAVQRGYDGLILRSPTLPYHYGVVGAQQEHMIKLKRWMVCYGTLIDILEDVQRDGPRVQPAGRAGAIVVAFRYQTTETLLTIREGIDHAERVRLWVNRDLLIGRTVRFRHQSNGEGAYRTNIYAGLVE